MDKIYELSRIEAEALVVVLRSMYISMTYQRIIYDLVRKLEAELDKR